MRNENAKVYALTKNDNGTTLFGGANTCDRSLSGHGCGTVFMITPSGTLTTLYGFSCSRSGCSDGFYPFSGLVQSTDGNFYGTTFFGGTFFCNHGCGVLYTLSVGLGPFVKTLPTSGKVGKTVGILGTNLIGTTQVTFNGVAAAFEVVSSWLIRTTVPRDATSGPIQVVTPAGALFEQRAFPGAAIRSRRARAPSPSAVCRYACSHLASPS
jgi:hypothetical protein